MVMKSEQMHWKEAGETRKTKLVEILKNIKNCGMKDE